MTFSIEKTPLSELLIVTPKIYSDTRGFFFESYNKKDFFSLGIKDNFVQDNHSKSSKGVLRGLHIQSKYTQSKLIRVIQGSVFDVVVDLRKNSSSFGKSFSIILSDENQKMLMIPQGFAHGFLALSESVEFLYKTSDYYHPEFETGIIWNDIDLNIQWPFKEYKIDNPIISEKDKKLLSFKEFQKNYV